MNNSHEIENEIEFKIRISKQVWEKIQPIDAIYKRVGDDRKNRRKEDRKYKVLPNGVWTYSLGRAIAQQKKDIPCRWYFKRSKVYKSDGAEKYITVHGYCNTCNAQMSGHVLKEPKADAVFVDQNQNYKN